MTIKKPTYQFEKQKVAKDMKVIDCPEHDPIKDFKRDRTGYYILIKLDWERTRIEVAICDKSHVIKKVFSGRRAVDVYHCILSYEKKYKQKWFSEKTHLAYLGNELKKAEFALVTGQNSYYQD